MTEYVLELVEQLVRAGLLLLLCKDNIMLKEKYRSGGRVLFFLQTFLVNYWLSHSEWLDTVLYKNGTGEINNSSYSIVKLVCAFLCSFIAMDILYQSRRQAKLYLLLVFYTIQEMVRFALHSVWSLSVAVCIHYLNQRLLEENIAIERFLEITGYIQLYSFLAFAVGYLLLMYVALRLYLRYQRSPVSELSRQGLWFLMLTPIMGMVFDILWRVSFFSRRGGQIEFLYEKHGSMYVVVPTIAVLCIVCTIFSRKIYSDLMRSEEQKNNLVFYKQQLADMTAHVKELEQLYDGIRGMRHDINNYVADMEQLLQISVSGGQISEQIRREAGQYLRSMSQAADKLTLRFCTGNPVTDVILNRKWQICMQEDIELDGDLLYPVQLEIEAFDVGILLNNALDNAIEACRSVLAKRHRSIRFRGYVKGRMFFLVVENTCDGAMIQSENGRLRTNKPDTEAHGLGMSNMQSCTEKYYGTIQYEVQKDVFVLTIMLQG